MELTAQPTKMTTLKTFKDHRGTKYELRGQKNMYSVENCFKTNYYELHKQDNRTGKFIKVGVKEERYIDSFHGYQPLSIKREKLNDFGKTIESSKVFKQLNGHDIEYSGEGLSMKGALRVLHSDEIPGGAKIKLPDSLNINGNKPLTSMAKRIMKLLANIK